MNSDAREIEVLDQFLDDVVQDVDTPIPMTNDLSSEMVACVRQVVRAEKSYAPGTNEQAALQARVWQQVLANRSKNSPREEFDWRNAVQPFNTAWLRVGMTLATLLIAISLSLYITASQPTPVSAQEILDKTKAALHSPSTAGVQSFVLMETQRTVPGNLRLNSFARLKADESLLTVSRRWYQAPNRWRTETQQYVVTPDGKQIPRDYSIEVSDGTDLWRYEQSNNLVSVDPLDPNTNGQGMVSLFGQNAETLQELFEQASTCFTPTVTASATIAERSAYSVDLGATRCRTASGPEMQGRLVIWVDKETFFVLKLEQHSTFDDKIIVTDEVASVQYNLAIDATQFKFAPPAGTNIIDNR